MIDNIYQLDYVACRTVLSQRLSEPAPGRIQLLTGPRQVGKTTLLLDLAKRLGNASHYAAMDDPAAALPGFWERIWQEAESRAASGRAVLLLDEIQHFADWAARLKAQYDRLKRKKIPLHLVASGSSALRLGAGSRESLAGRFERLTLTHWSASALKEQFGFSPADAAFQLNELRGLLEFCRRNPRFRPLVVTSPGNQAVAESAQIAAIAWHDFLLSGPH